MKESLSRITFCKVDPANTVLMEKIYRLRFDVYARQCKFIREEDYPQQLESDEYDRHSVHFAALDRSGKVLATTRIILTDEKMSPLLKAFPQLSDSCSFRPGSIVEVSRFIICKKSCYPENFAPRLSRHGKPGSVLRAYVVHGLFQAVYEEVKSRGITYWCALMEKSLQQLLKIYGFRTACLGQYVDMYGPVKPYLGTVADFEQSRPRVFGFYNVSRYLPLGDNAPASSADSSSSAMLATDMN